MRKSNSIISMTIIFFIIISGILPVLPVYSQENKVYISSAQDLVQFAEDSSIDSWSPGKTVLLDADIDLKEIDFIPIPIFSGIFDGQGHIIRGLSITVEGSNQGLFRYLQKDGVIKNLSVEGVVNPKGEKSTIGGIVGKNDGILEDCSFSGFVKGKDTVGGLVGWNGSLGSVINSSFNGIIYGESKVGGVIGYNAGTVLHCVNHSSVNTTVEEEKLELSEITIDNINLAKLVADVMDIGGIVGFNIGIVESSENHGEIGYPHVGYNIGGISGRQSGFMTRCINYGNVYGRKEVAGIVGQVEPHIDSIIGISQLSNLKGELNALDASITKMINDTKGFSNTITQNLALIQDNIDKSKTHAQFLIDQTEVMINDNIDELSKLGVIGEEALNRIFSITEMLESTIKTMGEAIEKLGLSLQYISVLMDQSSLLSDKFKDIASSLEDSIAQMIKLHDKLIGARLKIIEATKLLKNCQVDGVLELLQSACQDIKDVKMTIKMAIITFDPKAALDKIFDEIKETTESMESVGSLIENALSNMIESMDLMEMAIKDVAGVFDGLTDFLTFITSQEELEIETTNDQYEKTKEDLFGSINDIGKSLAGLIKDVGLEGNKLMDDMQSISDKLFSLMNLMINIIEEISTGSVSKDDIIKDVSGEDIENTTQGKVSDCKNFGTIDADLNVGGIAGGMSIELLDPEMDLVLNGKLSYNTVFETRAIIFSCENRGNIIAKKDKVGGIAGSMDLGYIKDCIVSSSIKSIDGNYVGGIAGKSDAPIESSYARCTLEGGNYIGGISGLGTEITKSYTLVKVNESRACVGAVAGNVDENSNLLENYFVSDLLRGIDGISYVGKAEPMTYQQLISTENIPNIFQEFKLDFWVNDQMIDSILFNYGDSISEDDFPMIPPEKMFYGKWEEIDIANLTFDTDIHAEYFPYLTILESEEKRNNIVSIVLVEGLFTDKDFLVLTEVEGIDPLLDEKSIELEKWNVVIPENEESIHTIRYLPEGNITNLELYVLKDDKWEKTKSQKDGKYLVFKSKENNITFSVVEGEVSNDKYIALIFFVMLMMIISIIMIRKTRRK